MIWHYFPIGFRFPVKDFSAKTKRACWEITVSALTASEGTGVTLYEAQENYDFLTDGPVYTCIACFCGVKQSRAVAKRLYALDALMTELCMQNPFVQANYLESYGPYPILGKLTETGITEITEAGEAFLPKETRPMRCSNGMRVLIAAEPLCGKLTAERVSKAIGETIVSFGFRVRRIPLANECCGMLRSLTIRRSGRLDHVSICGTDGEKTTVTIGVLPGSEAVIPKTEYFCDVLKQVMDLGYRKILICQKRDPVAEDAMRADERFSLCSISYLIGDENTHESQKESFAARIGFDAEAEQSECVILFAEKFTNETETQLTVLCELNKPACLLTTDPSIDRNRLMRAFPILREAIVCSNTDDTFENALSEAVNICIRKMTGKVVANTAAI